MNKFDPLPSGGQEAVIRYLDGDYRIMVPGDHVRCAVTGVAIPLEELRYWNVDRQEAYADAAAALAAFRKEHDPAAR